MNADSERFMRRAVELSTRGYPAPNPHVGCVVVKDGEVVGEGWHDFAGGPHAEAMALTIAGENARGADLYCTLEPCDHHGRTPPCSQAIVAAGVARVFVAVRDPNPVAAGGMETLRRAGVAWEIGLLADEARAANEPFLAAMERRRPFVVAKSAVTKDGFIARLDGTSKWITGEEAREEGHRLRAEMGCVLVGSETVRLDDPSLTARIPGVVVQPLRVVLDPMAALAKDYQVFCDGGRTVRFVGPGRAERPEDVEAPMSGDWFDLAAVLGLLFEQGATSLLVEGGAETVVSFLRAGLVDRFEKFVSPTQFGSGRPWLGKDPPDFRFKLVESRLIGGDLWESYRTPGT